MHPSETEPQRGGGDRSEAPPQESALKRWLARVVPWVVTLGALGWIYATTDLAAAAAALGNANWGLFFGSMCALYLVLWFVDSAAVRWIYRRVDVDEITIKDVLPARGTTYILGILNYAAGAAAMALYFKRRFRVGIVEGGASLLLLMLIDLGLIVLTALVGGSVLPEPYRTWVIYIAIAFGAGVVAHLVFWRSSFNWGPLERLRQHPSFAGFREATIRDYLTAAAYRAPVVAIYIGMHFFTLRAFDIHVPIDRLMVYVPLQMVLAVIPISVSGLGPVNAAQRAVYVPYVGGESNLPIIDAYGLSLLVGFMVPRIIIGLGSLWFASRALADAPAEDAS